MILAAGNKAVAAAPVAVPVFDEQDALMRLGGDRDALREIAGVFLDTAPARVRALVGAMEVGDVASVARHGHTIKGAAGAIGAIALSRAAALLEQTPANAAYCAQVEQVFAATVQELQARLNV